VVSLYPECVCAQGVPVTRRRIVTPEAVAIVIASTIMLIVLVAVYFIVEWVKENK